MKIQTSTMAMILLASCGSQETSSTDATSHGSTLAAIAGSASTTTCPNGGNLLNYGVDANGNGVLDNDEVAGHIDVCNGAQGAAGPAGAAGPQGPNGVDAVPNLGWQDSTGKNVPLFSSSVGTYWNYFDPNTNFVWTVSLNVGTNTYIVGPSSQLIFSFPYFSTTDCSGTMYFQTLSPSNTVTSLPAVGNPAATDPNYYAVATNANYTLITPASYFSGPPPFGSGQGCTTSPNSSPSYYIGHDNFVQVTPPQAPGTPPYHPVFH